MQNRHLGRKRTKQITRYLRGAQAGVRAPRPDCLPTVGSGRVAYVRRCPSRGRRRALSRGTDGTRPRGPPAVPGGGGARSPPSRCRAGVTASPLTRRRTERNTRTRVGYVSRRPGGGYGRRGASTGGDGETPTSTSPESRWPDGRCPTADATSTTGDY